MDQTKLAWLHLLATNPPALASFKAYCAAQIDQLAHTILTAPCSPQDLPILVASARGKREAYDELLSVIQNNQHQLTPTDQSRPVLMQAPRVTLPTFKRTS